MKNVVVRIASVWDAREIVFGPPDVVRIIGLTPDGRERLQELFLEWLSQKTPRAASRPRYVPHWYSYRERPTWFDVQVKNMKNAVVKEGIEECLKGM